MKERIIAVTPLEPPFTGAVVFVKLRVMDDPDDDWPPLALSEDDADKVVRLLGSREIKGRQIAVRPVPGSDPRRILIRALLQ